MGPKLKMKKAETLKPNVIWAETEPKLYIRLTTNPCIWENPQRASGSQGCGVCGTCSPSSDLPQVQDFGDSSDWQTAGRSPRHPCVQLSWPSLICSRPALQIGFRAVSIPIPKSSQFWILFSGIDSEIVGQKNCKMNRKGIFFWFTISPFREW